MAKSPEVDALKRDASALERAYTDHGGDLSKDPRRQHLPCIFCDDATGFAILEDTADGAARWACFAGKSDDCAVPAGKKTSGSIIDLVARKLKLEAGEATRLCLEKYGRAGGQASNAGGAKNAEKPRLKRTRSAGVWFPDAVQAQEWWNRKLGPHGLKFIKLWKYRDARGLPVVEVLRFDGTTISKKTGKRAKEFRQIHKDGQGWRTGLGPWGDEGKRVPLFNLPEILKAQTAGVKVLHVVEGEKKAERLAEAFAAAGRAEPVTSVLGGWHDKMDWTPVQGFERVIVWQDVDLVNPKTGTKAGEDKAWKSAACLKAANPKAQVLLVDLEKAGLQPGQDVYELIETEIGNGSDAAAVAAALDATAARFGKPWAQPSENQGPRFPGQPPAMPWNFGRHQDSDARPELRNWYVRKVEVEEEVEEEDGEGGTRTVKKKVKKAKRCQLQQSAVVDRVLELTQGALCRFRAPGAREPLLFYDREKGPNELHLPGGAGRDGAIEADEKGQAPAAFPRAIPEGAETAASFSGGAQEGIVNFVQNSTQFRSYLHNLGKLQFADKRDHEGTKFVTEVDLFHAFATDANVHEYEAVAMRPHHPPIPGHYYAWRPPAGYQPTGACFGQLLRYFTNVKAPKDLFLLAAAFMTPGWGGRPDKGCVYGWRPLQVIEAVDQGSGKTTIAQVIGDLWGGWMPVQLSGKGVDTFLERALSPGGLLTRLCLIDNVKGVLSHAAVEEWLTSKYIRGKRMYQGEATRPNDFTWITTLNNARLSRDMSERAFFIELKKPESRADWAKELHAFVSMNGPKIVADILEILRATLSFETLGLKDRWALWCEEVLARACENPEVQEVCRELFDGQVVEVAAVIAENEKKRGTCDIDVENAEEFWFGVRERICEPYLVPEQSLVDIQKAEQDAKKDQMGRKFLFVPTKQMNQWALDIMARKELNTNYVRQFIEGHNAAGRLPHVWFYRGSEGRGYAVALEAVVEELGRIAKEQEAKTKPEPQQSGFFA